MIDNFDAGSVEPRTISVLYGDSADSEYNFSGLKFSRLYESGLCCYKGASTEGDRRHLINSLTVVPTTRAMGNYSISLFYQFLYSSSIALVVLIVV